MNRIILLMCCFIGLLGYKANAQYAFYSSLPVTIPSGGSGVYDTIQASGMYPTHINGTFGLDSVSLNISYPYEYDLIISLIAPNGMVVHLTEQYGNGADFTATCFTTHCNNFANDGGSPFTGMYLPSNWLGNVNNGQAGNGNWVLHVENAGYGADTGILINWGLGFDSTPSAPNIFDSSTLPIVVLRLGNQPVIKFSNTEVAGSMGIINHATGYNHLYDTYNDYAGPISIKSRGSSSQWFPALPYSLSTKDITGTDSDAVVLGMPSDHSWILYEPWDDKSMMRNVLTYKLSNEMGDYAVRTHYVELVIDGDYRGVYVLEEKISRGPNRVAVPKLSATDTALPTISGGYIVSVDKNADASNSWVSGILPCPTATSPTIFQYIYPKAANINTQQKAYIAAYIDSFQQAADTANLYDTLHGYRHFIDVPSFIDQSLLQEVGRNVDGYRLSTYFHKGREGKLMGGPIWDFNLAYGNADYYNGWDPNTWQWDFPCPNSDPFLLPAWWQKMLTDTNYVQEMKCRYTLLRHDVLDTLRMAHYIDSVANVLSVPQTRHYTRWPIMGIYTWPNYYVGATYADEINYLKTWLNSRIRFMDSTLLDTSCHPAPPIISGVGNNTAASSLVSINPNPATSELYINCGSAFTYAVVMNSVGQAVLQTTVRTGKNTLGIGHLQPGIYFITIRGPEANYVSRFVKL